MVDLAVGRENTPEEAKAPPVLTAEEFRERVAALQAAMNLVPGSVQGDSDLCPLTHRFAEGVYVREIFIPAGTLIVGKIHKHTHPNFLMKGLVTVITEEGGMETLQAPKTMISPAGCKRVVFAHEDTVWVTVHVTSETDLEKIEDYVIAKDYEAFEAFKLANETPKFRLLDGGV